MRRGKGKDEEGKPRAAAPMRDPLRSGSNNQFIIEAPTAKVAEARSNEPSSSPRPRARSRRLSAPGSRHDAERASATVSVVAASAAATTEVAVASASRAT